MTVWAIVVFMLIVGGSIYVVTKIIKNIFCVDNGFPDFLKIFEAFITIIAIFVLAGYIKAVLIAL